MWWKDCAYDSRTASRATGRARSGGSHGRRLAVALAAVALLLSSAGRPAAAEAENATEPQSLYDGWHFIVVPYLWLPEIQGTVGAAGLSGPIDVDYSQIFDLIGNGEMFAAMGHFEAQRGPLSLFVDAVGGTARPSENVEFNRGSAKLKLTLNYAFVEFGPAYRVLDYPRRPGVKPIQLDLLIGGRFMYFYESLTFKGSGGRVDAEGSGTVTWVDPFVGLRYNVPLVGDLSLMFRGDIGGFSLGSQLAWNLIGGFEYILPWKPGGAETAVYAVYKALDFDYSTGSGNQKTILDLNMRGPGIGLGFAF